MVRTRAQVRAQAAAAAVAARVRREELRKRRRNRLFGVLILLLCTVLSAVLAHRWQVTETLNLPSDIENGFDALLELPKLFQFKSSLSNRRIWTRGHLAAVRIAWSLENTLHRADRRSVSQARDIIAHWLLLS